MGPLTDHSIIKPVILGILFFFACLVHIHADQVERSTSSPSSALPNFSFQAPGKNILLEAFIQSLSENNEDNNSRQKTAPGDLYLHPDENDIRKNRRPPEADAPDPKTSETLAEAAGELLKTTKTGRRVFRMGRELERFMGFKYTKGINEAPPSGIVRGRKGDETGGHRLSFSAELQPNGATIVEDLVFSMESDRPGARTAVTYELLEDRLTLEFSDKQLNRKIGTETRVNLIQDESGVSGALEFVFGF